MDISMNRLRAAADTISDVFSYAVAHINRAQDAYKLKSLISDLFGNRPYPKMKDLPERTTPKASKTKPPKISKTKPTKPPRGTTKKVSKTKPTKAPKSTKPKVGKTKPTKPSKSTTPKPTKKKKKTG